MPSQSRVEGQSVDTGPLASSGKFLLSLGRCRTFGINEIVNCKWFYYFNFVTLPIRELLKCMVSFIVMWSDRLILIQMESTEMRNFNSACKRVKLIDFSMHYATRAAYSKYNIFLIKIKIQWKYHFKPF